MWYMSAEPCHVSVLHFGAHDLGEVEWSRRCCTGLAFLRVNFCNLMQVSNIGYDLSWFATRHGDIRLFSPPLGL